MGCAASTGPLYRDEHDFATTAAYYDKDEDVKKDWIENEQLGEGMFARVVKITRKATNQQYACKVLRKTTVIEDNEIKRHLDVAPARRPRERSQRARVAGGA